MSNTINIALTGLEAFRKKLEVTANNTANANTDHFKKSRVTMAAACPDGVTVTISQVDTPGTPIPVDESGTVMEESSNVSLEEEMTDLVTTKHLFEANARVIQTADEITGTLLDTKA